MDYRARYYDATTGRFFSEDPIRFSGGVNFYSYVSNEATAFADPLGLCPPVDPCAGADPTKFDYKTPRFYPSNKATMSPWQHILKGHVFPVDPGNTRYVANGTLPAAVMAEVVLMNIETFNNPFNTVDVQGDRIRYTLYFPDITFGMLRRYRIGKNDAGQWLHTNVFVLDKNCKTVITSYPTLP